MRQGEKFEWLLFTARTAISTKWQHEASFVTDADKANQQLKRCRLPRRRSISRLHPRKTQTGGGKICSATTSLTRKVAHRFAASADAPKRQPRSFAKTVGASVHLQEGKLNFKKHPFRLFRSGCFFISKTDIEN